MKIKTAFIGIGGYAQQTVGALLDSKSDNIEIVAAADPFAEHSSLYGLLKNQCPFYNSIDAMYKSLDKRHYPDFTVITTPIQYHTRQIIKAVENGSNVLCEKPLTGDVDDIALLESATKKYGKFIGIGFQWSFSAAVQKLKRHITDGKLGKAVRLKTLVLWPRNKAYFTRSSGWAGKIRADSGEIILDSIANNAAAHFFHNIFYILGDTVETSAEATDIRASLLRVNDIETFDTATVKFKVKDAECLTVVSHSSKHTVEPSFLYEFENGVVKYPDDNGNITADLAGGEQIVYGNPFGEGVAHKIFQCLDLIKEGRKNVPCGVEAAKEHVKFIAALHRNNTVRQVNKQLVKEENGQLFIEGFDELLKECYNNFENLCETKNWRELIGANDE